MSNVARITISGSGTTTPDMGVFGTNSIAPLTISRHDEGVYYITAIGAFPGPDAAGNPRTWINQRTGHSSQDGGHVATEVYRINDDVIQVATTVDGTPYDYVQVSLEIRTR